MILYNDTVVFEKGDEVMVQDMNTNALVAETVEVGSTPVEQQHTKIPVLLATGDEFESEDTMVTAWSVVPLDHHIIKNMMD